MENILSILVFFPAIAGLLGFVVDKGSARTVITSYSIHYTKLYDPARQFNDFTDKAHEIFEAFALYASPSKAESLGEKVEVVFENGSITLDVVADEKIEGDIVKVPDFKAAKDVYTLFGGSRYQTVTLRKV